MAYVHFIFALLVFYILSVNSARILAFFPTTSLSHQLTFRPLTQELAKRGHEVIVITPDPAFKKGKCIQNLKEIDVHHSYTESNKIFNYTSSDDTDIYSQVLFFFYGFAKLFERQLRNAEVTALINDGNEKIDLLLLEACNRPSIALKHIYNVPTIQISSFGTLKINCELYDIPSHPLLYPTKLHKRTQNLTLWEKIKEIRNYFYVDRLMDKCESYENKLMKGYFGDNLPPIHDLSNKLDMLLLNVHPLWENCRPVPSSVVYLGNLHLVNEKELPKDLKSYMDLSEQGIIYFSLGTNVKCSMLANNLIKTFLNVFSKLPYNILWKCDVKEFEGQSKNIKISNWFPQSDLLKHPNVKLFITQGGLQSTDEAIAGGVPLIGIPYLADQWYNVERYVSHKIGIRLDKETITEEKLLNAINTVIKDPSYRRNVARLRSILYDQPQNSLERAVWWIEYVLKHGSAQHLRSPGANMPWTEYFELELLLIIILCIVTAIAIITFVVKYLCNKTQNMLMSLTFKAQPNNVKRK